MQAVDLTAFDKIHNCAVVCGGQRSGYGASSLPGGNERFVHDQTGHLLGEYDGKCNMVQETVWLGDLPVAELGLGNSRRYIAPDHLGAAHQITDPGRSPVWLWDHDPFGNGAPAGGFTYNLRFPGQYYNSETGLHYNGFRDYDPSTGRYVQTDPIGLEGGTNTYVYVSNSPIDSQIREEQMHCGIRLRTNS